MAKVKLDIDVGECFDRLSILSIKLNKCKNVPIKEGLQEQIENLQISINLSIGRDLGERIYLSREYKELKDCNDLIFKSIDMLRAEKEKLEIDWVKLGTLGVEIDAYNSDRFKWKQKLQNKFFSNEGEEIKL